MHLKANNNLARANAATDAAGGHTKGLASLAELVDHIDDLAGAGGTDRVTQRNARASRVDLLHLKGRDIDKGSSSDSGKSLVQLKEVEILDLDAGTVAELGNDLEGTLAHELLGNTNVTEGLELGKNGETELLGTLLGSQHDESGAIVEGARVGGGNGAAIWLEERLLLGEELHVELLGTLILGKNDLLLLVGDGDGQNVVEAAGLPRVDGVGVGAESHLIERLAGELVLVNHALGEEAHELALLADSGVGKRGEETINEGHISVHLILSAAGKKVARGVGHRLNTASKTNGDLAKHNATSNVVDGGATRGAVLMDSGAGRGNRSANKLANSLGNVGAAAILKHPTDGGVINVLGIKLGLVNCSLGSRNGELAGEDISESTAEGANGSANGRAENNLGESHGDELVLAIVFFFFAI